MGFAFKDVRDMATSTDQEAAIGKGSGKANSYKDLGPPWSKGAAMDVAGEGGDIKVRTLTLTLACKVQ
jgi:hypothetical protein